MSNFNQSKQHVGNQNNAYRDVVNIVNHIPPPVETAKAIWSFTSKCFQTMLPVKRDYSDVVRFNVKHTQEMNTIERERLDLQKMDSSRRAYAENRLIQLKAEEVQLQQEKFEWERLVVQENLKLIKKSHAIDLIDLEAKRKELQSKTDMHYLRLQGSREDIIQILSQDDGKFVVVPSPPDILRDDLQVFKSLKAEIPPKLKRTIEKYYGGITESVIGYRNIFDESIGESKALIVGELIAPIPTLIFHSQVTHQNVIIWITLTCPVFQPILSQTQTFDQQFTMQINQENFLLPEWNWMKLKKELEAQGQDCDTSSQTLLDLISTIHLIVTLYFCDLYCLNLNPNHNPKLFVFLADPDFPDGLQLWSKPLQEALLETQKRIKEGLKKFRNSETEHLRQKQRANPIESDDFPNVPVIASGIGLLLLFAMFNQQSPNITGGNASTPNAMQGQARTGIIQANDPGKNAANLRATPNGKVGRKIPNGDRVILGEISSDAQWQSVTTQDGEVGWVWAKYIRK